MVDAWRVSGRRPETLTDTLPERASGHDVADAAFDAIASRLRAGATAAELVEASGVIEDAGPIGAVFFVHGSQIFEAQGGAVYRVTA